MAAPEFVAVGHVTLDRFEGGVRLGGAALYAAITAHRLGASAAILTSHGDDFPLDELPTPIEVVSVAAAATTVFEHRAGAGERAMRVRAAAGPLAAGDLPEDWRDAPLVLLAPIVQEVHPDLAAAFGNTTVAAAAQGWLRTLDREGVVSACRWASAAGVLDRVQALFVSAADVRGQEEELTRWVERVPLAVVTAGADGALLYVNGDRFEVRPRPVRQMGMNGLPRQRQEAQSFLGRQRHCHTAPCANAPSAAATYPTTAFLSPETSPESPYRSTRAWRAPRSRAASITDTTGPPPQACSGTRSSSSSNPSGSKRSMKSSTRRSRREAVSAS